MDLPERSVYVRMQIDTNRINARGSLPAMNQLERWHEDDVIGLLISEVAQHEAIQGHSPARVARANGYIFSITHASTPDERLKLKQIERILSPGGNPTPNSVADAEIVFNAKKYGAILVTADGGSKSQPGGILGNRAALAKLGVRVMTDEEAVAFVRTKIVERDKIARLISTQTGQSLPSWVDRD